MHVNASACGECRVAASTPNVVLHSLSSRSLDEWQSPSILVLGAARWDLCNTAGLFFLTLSQVPQSPT